MTRDDLIAAFTAAAAAHPDIDALFLGGSLGRGTGDAWSDVDLIVVTPPDRHGAFVAGVKDWAAGVIAPVLWRQVYPGLPLFHVVAAGYLRYDITITVAGRVMESADRVRVLVDRAGVLATLAPTRAPAPPISPQAVQDIVQEFLRVIGLLPVGVGRKDYSAAATGVGLLRAQLQALMVLEQRPSHPPGALAVARMLPPEDVRALEELSSLQATRQGVIDASLAVAAVFLPRARRLAEEVSATWPTALEAAVRDHLRRELGLDLPG